MPRSDVTITTADGECPATFCTPEGSGPWPAVVLYPDAGGRRATMEDMAARVAGFGYAVLVPDVYYRAGAWAPFDLNTVFGDEDERKRLFTLMGGVTGANLETDAHAILGFFDARPEVSDTPIGTTGYCMGGRASLIVAGRLGDKVGAAASFHGGRLSADDPDAPIHLADKVKATVYVAGATDDGSFTAEDAEALDKAYTEAGVEHTIETYPGGHGFAVADHTGVYDEACSERHFAAMKDLYSAHLG
jgi:carboxymethylenebutenolidase